MIRLVLMGLVAAMAFGGCTAKEFNEGVNDAEAGIVRVIRGTNN